MLKFVNALLRKDARNLFGPEFLSYLILTKASIHLKAILINKPVADGF